MKTVFTNDEVVHRWASQQQEEGKNSTRSIFFDGPSIYSYGRHFEMARFVKPRVVLIYNGRYSITTSGHQARVRRAVSHCKTFEVPSMYDHTENLRYFFTQARESLLKSNRARTFKNGHLNDAVNRLRQAIDYAEEFPGAYPPDVRADLERARTNVFFDPAEVEKIQREADEAARKARERQAQERQKQEAEEREDLEAWLQGADRRRYFTATRLRVKNGNVETSHGASVPLSAARKLYRALKAGKEVRGVMCGLYTIAGLDSEHITIGCHVIPLSEIERIAPEVMQEELALS